MKKYNINLIEGFLKFNYSSNVCSLVGVSVNCRLTFVSFIRYDFVNKLHIEYDFCIDAEEKTICVIKLDEYCNSLDISDKDIEIINSLYTLV